MFISSRDKNTFQNIRIISLKLFKITKKSGCKKYCQGHPSNRCLQNPNMLKTKTNGL